MTKIHPSGASALGNTVICLPYTFRYQACSSKSSSISKGSIVILGINLTSGFDFAEEP